MQPRAFTARPAPAGQRSQGARHDGRVAEHRERT